MASKKHLETLPKKELQELARKAGKASGEARRQARSMREQARAMLDMAMKQGVTKDIEDVPSYSAFKKANKTTRNEMLVRLMHMALSGDIRAYELYLKVAGEMPSDKLEITQGIQIIEADELPE